MTAAVFADPEFVTVHFSPVSTARRFNISAQAPFDSLEQQLGSEMRNVQLDREQVRRIVLRFGLEEPRAQQPRACLLQQGQPPRGRIDEALNARPPRILKSCETISGARCLVSVTISYKSFTISAMEPATSIHRETVLDRDAWADALYFSGTIASSDLETREQENEAAELALMCAKLVPGPGPAGARPSQLRIAVSLANLE